ncbi:hypothetical protein GobsT_63720 [Gemmata obscuriglobus]|uniref:Uncharacterized protein n=1 Tax=Gemmata obscuriglobus TaxID=114 RepID=A0A2Z3GWF0_9BACT|nr:hypothetical protein [Gemmata obscuriglobus]AWM35897.1 hypothetical protein C1280_01975 [Gemmata obscuriglobus]QEG31550.1 hypothetical protein GobsT_63720 [Gemmata obscuriglobus]VTS10892.1 unnamed protein product [Gemmata obscuriglobus UQM 2246]
MPDLTDLLALRACAAGVWDAFAGFDDWQQKGDRMVSPSGKRTLTLAVFQKLKGRKKGEKRPAATGPKAPAAGKGGPKPGEQERILTMKAKVARDSHDAAVRAKLPAAELEPLRKRAEAAEAELKAGPKPSPTLPVASLPAVPKEVPAPAPPPKPKPAPPAKPKSPTAAPEFDPKKKVADPHAVVRQPPRTGPAPKGPAANRAGAAAAKVKAAATATGAPAVPPRADGSPNLPALKKSVDAGITTGRALGWNYETTAARAALKAAEKQIDDYARKFPRKLAPLAREVTGEAPDSTQDAVKKLKAWVGETLDLLDPGARQKGRTAHMSERAVVAELRGRLAGVRALCRALAG